MQCNMVRHKYGSFLFQTNRDAILGEDEFDCIACKLGQYCGNVNLTDATGPCDAGYFCLRGAKEPNPTGDDATVGGPCPVSHYCPTGTSYPLMCPAGTYNNRTGQSVCVTCPASYYCPENTTTFEVCI